ncbi:MAG: M20/M25/M40 family metallo-hydrolase [Anaerolineae bacterium]|nr:M20/M25/M40 family metallo-hydrolase [Anaerolineae bacterium]
MYLEQLSNAFGVSSAEGEVRKIIIEAAKPYADAWRVDTMGNLFVTRQQRGQVSGAPLRVMVSAHMDEVGFIITKITDSGHLKFETVGNINRRVLLGKVVVVGKERVPGVIGLKPIHLLTGDESRKVDDIKAMTIDIGAADKQANGKVMVGDLGTFATRFGRLGGQPNQRQDRGRVKGKALDNRAGCAVLLELLREDYAFELQAVLTVQEEVGARGARVATYATNPDLAFILEAPTTDDLPPTDPEAPDDGFPRLGDGPAITVMDRSFIADRRLVDLLIDTAEREGIPYQFKQPGVGGTDAGAVHVTREGVPSVVVSVPARYIHSPVAVLDLADFWNTVKLMQATLKRLPEEFK